MGRVRLVREAVKKFFEHVQKRGLTRIKAADLSLHARIRERCDLAFFSWACSWLAARWRGLKFLSA